MVELDVHRSIDSHLVVIHDETVDRTTNGHGRVEDKTLVELKKLDAGSGEKIPTLAQVCRLINRQAGINIELKGANTALSVAMLLNQLTRWGSWQREEFLVSSRNPGEVADFLIFKPEISRALIFGKRYFRTSPSRLLMDVPVSMFRTMDKVGAKTACVQFEFVTPTLVQEFHKRSLSVLVWTVNEPEDIRNMKNLGVDGIFSDYPDRLND